VRVRGLEKNQKMKIAIVYPPISAEKGYPLLSQSRQFRFSSSREVRIYPLLPASAATMLARAGHEVLFLDGINRRLSLEEFEMQLSSFRPELIVMETKAPVIREHWSFINRFKDKVKSKFVLVGDHVSFFPEESFENSSVDYCVTGGDYDFSLRKLADHLGNHGELPKGLYLREGAKVVNTGRFELSENLDTAPFIDRNLTHWKVYGEAYLHHPCTYILSGRGCGWSDGSGGRCTFCIWQHALWDCTARLRSPENVAEEIEILVKKYRVKEIFDDNESGAMWDKKWLEAFHKEMTKRNLIKKVFLSSNARGDSLDDETCRLLKATGFRLLKVGLESGSDGVLAKLNKGESLNKIVEGIKKAKDHGMKVLFTTMAGYPWETEEDAKMTYEVAKELMLYKTRFGDSLQASLVVPYPGTPLYRRALKEGWLIPKPNDYERFNMSEPVLKSSVDGRLWCQRLWKLYYHPSFMVRSLLSIRSVDDLKLVWRAAKSLVGHVKDFR